MTDEKRKKLEELFPDADIAYDLEDQMIIYTGLYWGPDGQDLTLDEHEQLEETLNKNLWRKK